MQRSAFVTVVAWIFIFLSGFSTLSASLPLVMMPTVARMPEFNEAVDNLPQNDWFDDSRSLVTATSFLFVFVIIVSLFSLSLSIGLLNRKWWARIPFIGEMVLWALLAVYVLQVQIRACIHMPDKYTFPFNVPGPGIIFTIGGGIFCIWVIKCLLSRQVASEFRRG